MACTSTSEGERSRLKRRSHPKRWAWGAGWEGNRPTPPRTPVWPPGRHGPRLPRAVMERPGLSRAPGLFQGGSGTARPTSVHEFMALYQNRNSPLCPKLTLAHRLGPLDSGSKTVPRCWAADGEWNMGCSKSTAFPSFQTFLGFPRGQTAATR